MENLEESKKCLNCEIENFRFKKGYCKKCYPLVLRIEKIQNNILPDVLENIRTSSNFFEDSKKEYVRQIQYRLRIMKEANVFKEVSGHDLEFRINETLRILDNKNIGKINDSLASNLEDDRVRSYVYRLFTKIQLLKPFKIDYYRLYNPT